MKTLLALSALVSTVALATNAPTAPNSSMNEDDKKAVHEACADYLYGIYEVDPERIERSVHPELRKIGFGRWGDMKEYKTYPMTYEQLHDLAGQWNAKGDKVTDESPRKIEVLDVLDKTATAKLTAEWGIDYFHLAKYDDEWKIINVLWQSHPPQKKAAEASSDK